MAQQIANIQIQQADILNLLAAQTHDQPKILQNAPRVYMHRRAVSPVSSGDDEATVDNPFAPLAAPDEESRHWEAGFKIETPEVTGGMDPDGFLDWLISVEEILEFKDVALDCLASLVDTRLRGRAAAWWFQLKSTRSRLGKDKIRTWEKFFAHNFCLLTTILSFIKD